MIISTVQDNSERAKQAIMLLWTTAFLFAFFTLLTLLVPVEAEDGPLALLQSIVALVLLGLSTITAVYFIRWFRRAYANLRRAGRRIQYADGWAAGAWFIPFLNLFRPYSIMKEVWNGTFQLAYAQQPPHLLLRWWWMIFVLTSTVGRAASASSRHAETAQQLETAAVYDAVHTVFIIVFIALTIACIKRIAVAEEQLLLRQQVEAIGGPAPEPLSYYPDEEMLAY